MFIVEGHPKAGKKEAILLVANYGYELGYFEDVAANFETEKFEKLISLEQVGNWIGENKIFILGGAERHLDKADKRRKMNKEFLRTAKEVRQVGGKIFLLVPMPSRDRKTDKNTSLQRTVNIDERIIDDNLFNGWIIKLGNINRPKDWFSFQSKAPMNFIPSGMIRNYRKNFEDYLVDYSKNDPCDFQVSGGNKSLDKTGEDSIDSRYIEQFIEQDGKYTKAAKEMGLDSNTFRRRLIQDLKELI